MMVNFDLNILKNIISDYKQNFPDIHRHEIYKWRAIKCFQDNWDINAANFPEMLNQALDKSMNLLAAQNFYPKKMITFFAQKDPEAVRAMFVALYEESVPVIERIDNFIGSSNALLQKYGEGTWKMHYQNTNSISTYLFFRYPNKYYIFKFNKFKDFAAKISYPYTPQKGKTENVQNYFEMCNGVLKYVLQDSELLQMSRERLMADEYNDEDYHVLTEDIIFFGSYSEEKVFEWWPSENEYDPGISTETWLELLKNESVFKKESLAIMKRFLDIGGEATCTQLSRKYGEKKNFYNVGSSRLAKRVWETTGCPLTTHENENSKWWPVLFIGKEARSDQDGSYIWKLRAELKAALEQIDLSSIPLYSEGEEKEIAANYWWLNANPRIWSFASLRIGEEDNYTLLNEAGHKRRIYQNFLYAQEGDIIVGYESSPTKKIVALGRITRPHDGVALYFEKTEGLTTPIDYSLLKEINELQNMEFFINRQGSLFRLTEEEYNIILDLIREQNPIIKPKTLPIYDKITFLSEVYIDEEEYGKLVALLMKKKNIILQGAPGVGKTFAAKRLAYSILGKVDKQRVKIVQFHQSYTYEDFVMGYKPYEDGFKLEPGIFDRFCKLAENDPDEKYFFIIDEINRGNLSKIFGELLMLIEKDYRGEIIDLNYSGVSFFVPENIYIIGMMNTADRSLAMIDYALRRRFSFFDLVPAFYNEKFINYQQRLNSELLDNLIIVVKDLNQVIVNDPSLGNGFCIGHSYFCGQSVCTNEWVKQVVEYELIPTLKEYWFDDNDKANYWITRLQGVVNEYE